jgi:hypothetical protein
MPDPSSAPSFAAAVRRRGDSVPTCGQSGAYFR